MLPVYIMPARKIAYEKLHNECVTLGVSLYSRKKYTDVLEQLDSAIAEAFLIPSRRPEWFDVYCNKMAKSPPPRFVKGRISAQEKTFLERVVLFMPVFALLGYNFKRVKFGPGDTLKDLMDKLRAEKLKGEAKFLSLFIKYMAEHLIPHDLTGYREEDILARDAGSKRKSFLDKRSKEGYLGWSYQFIRDLGGPNIGPQHEDLLSGHCYDYWLIWDLVIPEAGKIFIGKSKNHRKCLRKSGIRVYRNRKKR